MKKFIYVLMVLLVTVSVFASDWVVGFSVDSSKMQDIVKDAENGWEVIDTDPIGIGVEVYGDHKVNDIIFVTPSLRIDVPYKASSGFGRCHFITVGVGATYEEGFKDGYIKTTVSPVATLNLESKDIGFGVRADLDADVYVNETWAMVYGAYIGFLKVKEHNYCNYGLKVGASFNI